MIVPQLITRYGIEQPSKSLSDCRLFSTNYAWIKKAASDNGALLAMYFNAYLKKEIGKKREEWSVADFDIAFEKLYIAEEFVEKVLREYLHIEDSEE